MKKVAITVLIAGAVVAIFGIGKTSNCGGNPAALSYARHIAMSCYNSLYDKNENESLRIEDWLADSENRERLDFSWGVKSFWLKKKIKKDDELPVAVCGQMFSNVPQPTIWNLFKKNPGFAASYIDGTARILTIEEFNDFNFTDYTYIHNANFEPVDQANASNAASVNLNQSARIR